MSIETSSLFVKKTGKGNKALLLFHGFGQDHTSLLTLAEALGDRYTCYLFDLYFHGQSRWPHGDRPLEKGEWQHYLKGFLQDHHIHTFSVLGFSLGARLALASLEAFPTRTQELFLVAPDGIPASPWYTLATGSLAGRRFFQAAMTRPALFYRLSSLVQRLGWLNPKLRQVAEYHMRHPQKREQIYYSWTAFRRLQFVPARLAKLIRHHRIRTVIVAGRHDTVVPPARMQGLLKQLKDTDCTFLLLDKSHHQLLGNELLDMMR